MVGVFATGTSTQPPVRVYEIAFVENCHTPATSLRVITGISLSNPCVSTRLTSLPGVISSGQNVALDIVELHDWRIRWGALSMGFRPFNGGEVLDEECNVFACPRL